jgi:predicted RND superfamily exporter protein
VFVVSPDFSTAAERRSVLASTVHAWVGAAAVSLGATTLFLGNLLVAMLALACAASAAITTAGLLFALPGFTFGAAEAVSITFMVGLSVEYVLYVAQGYQQSLQPDRSGRVREALTHLGASIISAAVTTTGCCSLMLLSEFQSLRQFAVVVVVHTLVALFFSVGLLSATLVTCGPTRRFCDVWFCCRKGQRRTFDNKNKKSESGSAVAPEASRKLEQKESWKLQAMEDERVWDNGDESSDVDDAHFF